MPGLQSSSHTHTDTPTQVARSVGDFASPSSPTEIYDVVVVGAGPVGLATAIGLRQRGIKNLLVVDQARTFRRVGRVVDLLPTGLKALKYLDSKAYEKVRETGRKFYIPMLANEKKMAWGTTQRQQPPKTSSKWILKNLEGQVIRTISLDYDDWLKNYGEGRVSIAWYDLQTILRHLLPLGLVKANHLCINVVEEPEFGCVRIDCVSNTGAEVNPNTYRADGEKHDEPQSQNSETIFQQPETKSFWARLVVGADGINSRVRRDLYTNSSYRTQAQPEYSGFTSVECKETFEIPNALLTEIEERFLQDSPIVRIINDEVSEDSARREDPSMLLFRRPSGQLGYIIQLALYLEELKGKSGGSFIELTVQKLERSGFPSMLKQLVSISPPGNMQQRPYYIHRATDSIQLPSTAALNAGSHSLKIEPAWSAGRVVLVGDAAHGMPPFMAEGTNQGFEDAAAVATLVARLAEENNLDDTKAVTEAFEKYERLRRPLIVRIQQATLRRLIYCPEKEWQKYNQQVHGRNFNQVMGSLL